MTIKSTRGGRPNKPDHEKQDRIVRVLFNQDEFKQLQARRQTTRSRNMSAFIRDICLEKPLLMRVASNTQQDNIASILQEIRTDFLRLGVNINQSTRRINSTTDYQDLQREVNQLSRDMASIDTQLRTMLTTVNSYDSQPQLSDGSPHQ